MAALTIETHGKAIVVRGDTKPVKDFLKAKGGSWNKGLIGWCFPGSKKAQLLEDLKGCSNVSSVEDKTGGLASTSATPARNSNKRAADSAPAEQPPEKKVAPSKNEEEDGIAGLEGAIRISEYLYVQVLEGASVDIRRYYKDKTSGEIKPTPKGIRMSKEEWQAVVDAADKIDSAGAGEPIQVIQSIKAEAKDDRVDIRRQYVDKADGTEKPTRKGANLSTAEWQILKSQFQQICTDLGSSGAAASSARSDKRKSGAVDTPKASQQASEKKTSGNGDDVKLEEGLRDLLKDRDMNSVTLKQIRSELEKKQGLAEGSLEDSKAKIKALVTDIINGTS
jgi:hypothetical protein